MIATTEIDHAAMERFMRRVVVVGDCWQWTGFIRKSGYAEFNAAGRSCLAHRFAYAELVGQLVAGLQLDHLCRNRSCVNPAHLEQVTARENNARSASVSAAHIGKTHCVHGHVFDEANTYWYHGTRMCRRCGADSKQRQRCRRKPLG